MVDYRVRSVSLLNLVNDIRSEVLIPDAYFQRNLVWRDIHKKDFIKTILLGFPFPQIFISKGKVDVARMSTISCIVDGQQRADAIIKFIENEFDVEGKFFDNLTSDEKSQFLKYEVAVIELDIENDDSRVQQIFQRINRTSNALTVIEKLASEFSVSEFMLVAKLLSNQIELNEKSDSDDFREDPNIPESFYEWARKQKLKKFIQLLTDKGIFNSREIARKVHLMHVLNIMSTILTNFFNRNEVSLKLLNDYTKDFDRKDELVEQLEKSADIILSMKLPAKSYWFNKSNMFSLLVSVAKNIDRLEPQVVMKLKTELDRFETEIPEDYKLAATEAVNNTKERELRNKYIVQLIDKSV